MSPTPGPADQGATLTVLCDYKRCRDPALQHTAYDVQPLPGGGHTFRSKDRCPEHRILTLCKIILTQHAGRTEDLVPTTFTSWEDAENAVRARAKAMPKDMVGSHKAQLTLIYCEGDTDELTIQFDYDLFRLASSHFVTPRERVQRAVGLYTGRWKPAYMSQAQFEEFVRIARRVPPYGQSPGFLEACERVGDSEGWIHREDLHEPARPAKL